MSRSHMAHYTPDQTAKVRAFLNQQRFNQKQWEESYQSWIYGGRGWDILRSGGTTIHQALCWYQNIHRPGSKEWRPSVIARALLQAIELP